MEIPSRSSAIYQRVFRFAMTTSYISFGTEACKTFSTELNHWWTFTSTRFFWNADDSKNAASLIFWFSLLAGKTKNFWRFLFLGWPPKKKTHRNIVGILFDFHTTTWCRQEFSTSTLLHPVGQRNKNTSATQPPPTVSRQETHGTSGH